MQDRLGQCFLYIFDDHTAYNYSLFLYRLEVQRFVYTSEYRVEYSNTAACVL